MFELQLVKCFSAAQLFDVLLEWAEDLEPVHSFVAKFRLLASIEVENHAKMLILKVCENPVLHNHLFCVSHLSALFKTGSKSGVINFSFST